MNRARAGAHGPRMHRCLEFAIGAYAARFYLPQYPD